PFLFFELKQANEKIKSNFNHNETRYKPILNIIDQRWENQMSRPLHYVTYWLNLRIHYVEGFNPNDNVLKKSLYECVHRLIWDHEERLMIMEQLDSFTKAKGMLFEYGSTELLQRKHHIDGGIILEMILPSFSDLLSELSVTTSAFGCERNWSVFKMVKI
ncbi:hypothetical protein LINGRAHAP2_LOCUS30126, partial [Linum grandiflorum]